MFCRKQLDPGDHSACADHTIVQYCDHGPALRSLVATEHDVRLLPLSSGNWINSVSPTHWCLLLRICALHRELHSRALDSNITLGLSSWQQRITYSSSSSIWKAAILGAHRRPVPVKSSDCDYVMLFLHI